MYNLQNCDEDFVRRSVSRKAEIYAEEFRGYIEDLSEAQIFDLAGRQMTEFDVYAVGSMLESYAMYEQFVNEQGSYSDLGVLPRIAFDTIVLAYGTSVASILSSTQPLEDYVGNVYFKKLIAQTVSRGGINAGDTVFDSNPEAANPNFFNTNLPNYGSEYNKVVPAQTAAGVLTYSLPLTAVPLRKFSVNIKLLSGGAPVALPSGIGPVVAQDNGEGMILGVGVSGQIDYTTGQLDLVFVEDPAAAYDIQVEYHTDFEKSADLPGMQMEMSSTSVRAEVIALKMHMGALQAFAFAKRFGRMADDDAVLDLSGSMAAIASSRTINKWLECAANSGIPTIQHALTTPPGVSELEHKKAFQYRIAEADAAINKAANRGKVNRLVCGSAASVFVQGIPGFKGAGFNTAVGPHILGTLGDIIVVRDNALPTNNCYPGYISVTSNFEVPVVQGVFMPLFITSTLQNGNNPLASQKAAAMWNAYKSVVPQFVCTIQLV